MRELSAAAHVRSWPGYAPPQYRLSCGRCLFIRQGLSSLDFDAQLLPNSTLPTCPRHQRWPPERGSPEVALQGGSPTPGWLRSGPQALQPPCAAGAGGNLALPLPSGALLLLPHLALDPAALQQEPAEGLHAAGTRLCSPRPAGAARCRSSRPCSTAGKEGVDGGEGKGLRERKGRG